MTFRNHPFSKIVFDPQREDLIDPQYMVHYLTASLTFYKRYSTKCNPSLPRKIITDPSNAVLSIEYIINENLEASYQNQKKMFQEQGKVRKEVFMCPQKDILSLKSLL